MHTTNLIVIACLQIGEDGVHLQCKNKRKFGREKEVLNSEKMNLCQIQKLGVVQIGIFEQQQKLRVIDGVRLTKIKSHRKNRACVNGVLRTFRQEMRITGANLSCLVPSDMSIATVFRVAYLTNIPRNIGRCSEKTSLTSGAN